MGIYLIPNHHLFLILHTLKHFPMFFTFQTSFLRGEKVIGMMVEDHSFKNHLSLFISYSITRVVNRLHQSIFIFHITTIINAFQTQLHFETGISKPLFFYCKSEFWQWIIKYSDLSVTFSFNLHHAFTTHSLPILRYYGGITVLIR